ncbi:2984_t:CDS:2, partial [Funneliformis caledonium]
DKWYAINRLVIILEDFAEVTEYLSGSNYTTISLMYSLLAIISKNIVLDDSSIEVVDLTSPNTAFDDNVGYEDALEDEKININILQNCNDLKNRVKAALYQSINHYWKIPQEQGILATLLDPRFKNQETESRPISSNSLLARMFQNDHTCIDE